MSNMSYCRFENTLHDLRDCRAVLNDPLSGQRELDARASLIELCQKIVDDAVPNEELRDKCEVCEDNTATTAGRAGISLCADCAFEAGVTEGMEAAVPESQRKRIAEAVHD